jgi:hypothetical protein
MHHPAEPRRLWRAGLLAALAAALLALAVQQARPGRGLGALPLHDFVEYWAAGRLLVRGENPYDPARMGELERDAGREEEGILMWCPPWALALVAPLGLLDCRTAHPIWLLFHLAVLLGCADALWRYYGGPASLRWLGWLLGVAFVPSGVALLAGQVSPLLLLGATGFLVFQRRRLDALAGASTAFLAVKPHLSYLFWIALAVWAVRQRRWRVLAGGALAGLALTGVALALEPGVLGHYWHTLHSAPPAQYRSPTLGTLLRLALGEGPFALQFVTTLPGLAWLAWHGWRRRRGWDWGEQLPLLLLASMLTAAYGAWPFDLVLLLVAVLRAAALLADGGPRRARLLAATAYLGVNALALALVLREVEYLGFIWMAPALLLAYLALRPGAPGSFPASYPNIPRRALASDGSGR